MKKIKLLSILGALLISQSAFANNWYSLSFPKSSPQYHTVSKSDQSKKTKLTFSCLKEDKTILLLGLSGLNNVEDGKFKFTASTKDKYRTDINGFYTVSKDGEINLITGSSKDKIIKDFRTMYGTTLELTTKSGEKHKINFDLIGSSVALKELDKKCNKL